VNSAFADMSQIFYPDVTVVFSQTCGSDEGKKCCLTLQSRFFCVRGAKGASGYGNAPN
jgi:hypothetical protein